MAKKKLKFSTYLYSGPLLRISVAHEPTLEDGWLWWWEVEKARSGEVGMRGLGKRELGQNLKYDVNVDSSKMRI